MHKKDDSFNAIIFKHVLPILLIPVWFISRDTVLPHIGDTGWTIVLIAIILGNFLPLGIATLQSRWEEKRDRERTDRLRLFFGSTEAADTIRNSGTAAMATILSVGEFSEGGVYEINGQPVLELRLSIEEKDSPPRKIQFDTIIPLSWLSRLQAGIVLPVRFDPSSPDRIVFAPEK